MTAPRIRNHMPTPVAAAMDIPLREMETPFGIGGPLPVFLEMGVGMNGEHAAVTSASIG